MSRKYFKKVSAVVIMALLSVLVSCQGEVALESNGGNILPTQRDEDVQNDAEPAKILPNLPDADYDGYEFKILSIVDGDFSKDDFLAEEITGEVINDAIFARNSYVEEKYNIRLKPITAGEPQWNGGGATRIRRSAAAGDAEYDAAVVWGYDAANLTTQGLLADLNDTPHIDLSQPWWDQRANEDLSIRDKMFFTTGDISMLVADATSAMMFNKQLAQEYALPDLYQIARDGAWTWDKFSEYTKMVSADVNGDGIMDQNDRYGFLVIDDFMVETINCIGERIAGINREGNLELSLYNDRSVAMYSLVMDLITDSTVVFPTQRVAVDQQGRIMFENNQGLFFAHGMLSIIRLRAMETEFGILPYPKFNEQQASYYTPLIVWWSMYLCIPAIQEDISRTGLILEALAAESRYTVRPAYYDISLIGKHTRDEESTEMLDIVFGTRVYDLGWYYSIGDYAMGMINIFRNSSGNFTTVYERSLGRAERDLERINNLFDEFIN